MRRRLVATLLVMGVARAGHAADDAPPPSPVASPPLAVPAEPAPVPAEPPTTPPPAAPATTPPPLPAEPTAAPPAAVLVAPLVAPPPPPSGAGPLVAGMLTAFVPFVVGCALWANSDQGDLEKAGTYVMVTGFAAAPWVSHGLQGRWKRGAAFGAVSTALAAATLVAMDEKDPFYAPFANRQRVPFGMLLTASMFSAAIGVFDSFLTAPAREAP